MKIETIFTDKDWMITTDMSYTNTPYIIHNCDLERNETKFTRAIVPQAPLSRMTYPEYVEQMGCQFCHAHPPDNIITIWTLLSWDKVSK